MDKKIPILIWKNKGVYVCSSPLIDYYAEADTKKILIDYYKDGIKKYLEALPEDERHRIMGLMPTANVDISVKSISINNSSTDP